MRCSRRTLGIVAGAAFLTVAAAGWWSRPALEALPNSDSSLADTQPLPQLTTETVSFRRGDTLEVLLDRAGADVDTRVGMIDAVNNAFDVRKFRAGSELTMVRTAAGSLAALEYVVDPDHMLAVSRTGGRFNAAIVEIPGAVTTSAVCGTLEGSLFESVERMGEQAELAIRMAEIFAWDLDFYRDPREGDQFCLLVEKKEYDNGQPPTYKRILSAEYNNAGTKYDAFLFDAQEGEGHYYSADGRSLQSAFLRSPLAFEARISSRFSTARLHPITGQVRPHLGTDYAAPTGTPVRAVASGKVIFAARSGGSGNLITLRHANGFDTQYLHLSKILVRVGQQVTQGQKIGLVGMTGLATGPHLDFRVRQHGKYIDFQRMKVPRISSISKQYMDQFEDLRDEYMARMSFAPGRDRQMLASESPQDEQTAAE